MLPQQYVQSISSTPKKTCIAQMHWLVPALDFFRSVFKQTGEQEFGINTARNWDVKWHILNTSISSVCTPPTNYKQHSLRMIPQLVVTWLITWFNVSRHIILVSYLLGHQFMPTSDINRLHTSRFCSMFGHTFHGPIKYTVRSQSHPGDCTILFQFLHQFIFCNVVNCHKLAF